ncbi:peptidoglycan-binding domain-containing protein [Actinocorallia herbida]|uniref:peptidoglycan-binding domain-containing protein n=1 Tax=Actinocorallia herbida TaxID=58109 RepID=UPI0014777A4F|nr:peptidoglycan-binding domain-containing protein [Actinocorallia herbida]
MAAPNPTCYPLLKLKTPNMTGNPVEDAQLRLNHHKANPAVTVDGIFGPKTAEAVKKFQARHGIDQDGEIGPKTWTELLEVKVTA